MLWQLPRPALALVLALFGAMVGSFMNVVAWRLPRERSLWRRGSACPRCDRPIRWFENIPLLSWLALRGRCAGCRGAISARYPLVETGCALLFAWGAFRLPASPWLLFEGAVFSLLLALALIDADWRLLPDDLTLALLAAGTLAYNRPGGPAYLRLGIPPGPLMGYGLSLGLLLPLLLRWLYAALRGREGLGLGDVKLLAALGALYGPFPLLLIVLFSALAGILSGIAFALWYAADWRRRRLARGLPADGRSRAAARLRALRHFPLPYGTLIAAAAPFALALAPRLLRFFPL